jgi:hypothetical protein
MTTEITAPGFDYGQLDGDTWKVVQDARDEIRRPRQANGREHRRDRPPTDRGPITTCAPRQCRHRDRAPDSAGCCVRFVRAGLARVLTKNG